jgi:predicted amidohydrolase YtcJ
MKFRSALALAIFALLSAGTGYGQQTADLILHNGKVLTVDNKFSIVEAVAVRGNQIVAVGSNDDVLKMAGPNTQKIDLAGRTVVPGLIDTHLHITGPGQYAEGLNPEKTHAMALDWRGVRTKDDVLSQIKSYLAQYHFKPGEWLYFQDRIQTGLNEDGVTGTARLDQVKILYDELNATELDKVAPDNPIVLTLGIPDENGLLVNGKALEILFKNEGPFIKKYGRFWINAGGMPEGHLEPPATRLVLNKYTPRLKPEDMADGIEKYLQELNAGGVTTISTKMRLNGIDAYKLLRSRGDLTVRLGYGLGWDYFGSVLDLQTGLKQFEGVTGSGDDLLWVTSVAPSSVDGASTRACTNQKRAGGAFGLLDSWWPLGQCHTDSEFKGSPKKGAPIQGNYFHDWLVIGAKYNLRVANDHVAGDRSVENMLSAVEESRKLYGPKAAQNWGFDHCVLVDPADFKRAARDGVMFSCAPKYIQDVAPTAAVSYGDKIANTFIVPVKSMIDSGVKVVFESDRDSFKWADLQIFLTRKDKSGKVWGAQEKLDRPTALRMITRWAADYVLKGDKLGSIETGKLADLAVLDRDYMTVPVEEVGAIRPDLTMLDGKIVFLSTKFSQQSNLKPAGAVVSTYEGLTGRRAGKRGFSEPGAGGG